MGEFPSGQRGQTVNLLSLTSMVRIHLLPPKEKGIRMDAFFRFAKQNFVREHRFAPMRQEPAAPPQTPRGLRPQTAPPTAAAGRPLRSNVVGTYGSPTNAPSLTVEREWESRIPFCWAGAGCCWKPVAVGRAAASLQCGRILRFPHNPPGTAFCPSSLSGGSPNKKGTTQVVPFSAFSASWAAASSASTQAL